LFFNKQFTSARRLSFNGSDVRFELAGFGHVLMESSNGWIVGPRRTLLELRWTRVKDVPCGTFIEVSVIWAI
jgi:hypothetical protein